MKRAPVLRIDADISRLSIARKSTLRTNQSSGEWAEVKASTSVANAVIGSVTLPVYTKSGKSKRVPDV